MVEKGATVPGGLAERPGGGILSEAYDANIARQCSGGKVVRCTGRSAEHSPVSWGSWGIAIPRAALFFCTVNGTFSFRRDEKKMWGWNSGFWKIPRSCWLRPRKHTPQVRETDTCSTHESFLQELAARYFPPVESTQRPLGHLDAPQTLGDSSGASGLVTRCI